MAKAALVVFADIETHEGLARVVNALETTKEFKQAGDDVKLIFDGAGTRWIGVLARPEHKAHALFEAVRDRVEGVCAHCARAFGVEAEVKSSQIPLLSEFEGHPSLRTLVVEGFAILMF